MNPFSIPSNNTSTTTVSQPLEPTQRDGDKMPARRGRRGSDSNDGKAGRYRAKNEELFSREIKADENSSLKIYSRDFDNLYPLRMEKAINNSPTGRRCANMMSKYIAGKGNAVNYLVNDNLYINDVITDAALDLAYQGGVFFKVKYYIDEARQSGDKLVFSPTLDTLDYVLMAVSKEDDDKNVGRYYVLKSDGEGGVKTGEEDVNEWYYPFSSNPDVVLYQMLNDCRLKGIEDPTTEELISNYRGQVNYLNTTPRYKYALGLADSVYNDLDTESRISTYNNVQTRKGFLGKTVVKMYDNGEEDNGDFVENVKNYLGAENSGNVLVVEVPTNVEGKLQDAFVIEQLKPQFDDKLFESTIKNLRLNIMGAFNNIPEPLVFSSSGALFGTSADTYTEMKTFYWEQNESLRAKLIHELNKMGFPVEIQSLIEPKQTTVEDGKK